MVGPSHPAQVNAARRLGYRLLGDRFGYLLHTRPAEWPIMTAHTAVGYLLAVGWSGAASGVHLERAALGVALWVIGLNGGTLALNSAFDRDTGDIGYLRAPPAVPRHLAAFGLVLMGTGLVLALTLPRPFRMVYAACALMSVAYSVPPLRLKAVAGVDWLINMIGFGTLTPYAGFASTGRPLEPFQALVLLGFCPLFAALYPLTQLYQFDEDRRRGDRTLALILGMGRSLQGAVVCAAGAFGLFFAAGLRAGWRVTDADLFRWGGLILAAIAWGKVLLPWLAGHEHMTTGEHQRGMYRALAAWALTDVVVVLAWGS